MSSTLAEKLRSEIDTIGFAAFSTSGMSMYPFLKNKRDVSVVVKTESKVKKYDVILYEDGCHRLVLHRVIKVGESSAFIRGDNCKSGEWVDYGCFIGILSEFTRKGKDGKVTDFGYKVYSRLIVLFHPFVKLRIVALESVYKMYCRLFKGKNTKG